MSRSKNEACFPWRSLCFREANAFSDFRFEDKIDNF